MEQTEELRQIIESASNGYWFPFVIMASSFSVIISLLLYITNLMIKNNNKRHEKTEMILEKLADDTTDIKLLITRHEKDIEHLKK